MSLLKIFEVYVAGKQQDADDQQPSTVAITYVCELGEHCRCAEGDEPGCWNWIEKVNV